MSILSISILRKFFNVPLRFFVFNNFIPVFGLMILNWEISDIFLFFIIELFIVGIITIIKIILLKNHTQYRIGTLNGEHNDEDNSHIKKSSVLVFLVIYGMYIIAFSWIIINEFEIQIDKSVLLTIPVALLSRTSLLVLDYFKDKTYFTKKPMDSATGFLVPMTVILISTIFITHLGPNILGLVLFLFIKTCADYWIYKSEELRI